MDSGSIYGITAGSSLLNKIKKRKSFLTFSPRLEAGSEPRSSHTCNRSTISAQKLIKSERILLGHVAAFQSNHTRSGTVVGIGNLSRRRGMHCGNGMIEMRSQIQINCRSRLARRKQITMQPRGQNIDRTRKWQTYKRITSFKPQIKLKP